MPNDQTDYGSPVDVISGTPRQADERALENLWAKGRQAWKDVTSPTMWVEELRGNQPQNEPRELSGA